MNQNRVEPLIHTTRVRSAEEDREGWAFDIAKRVLPAIVNKGEYDPDFAAELAYEFADALLNKARKRCGCVVAAEQKRADAGAFEKVRKLALADSLPD